MNFQSWLYKAVRVLTRSSSPYLDAEILLKFVTKRSRAFLLAFSETLLTLEQETYLSALLERRKKGEPIAYLVGEREFWSLPIYVSKATLIPRPETECLVEHALERLPKRAVHILDLGTGSGAIAIAVANERPDCKVTAVDLIPNAIKLAYRNSVRLGISNVLFLRSYWFSSLFGQKFDMVLSNPPYIAPHDPDILQNNLFFEPKIALISPNKGIAALRYIIQNAHQYLFPGGWLLVEHGWKQGKIVWSLFIQAGFQNVETYRDYSGNERLTAGQIL